MKRDMLNRRSFITLSGLGLLSSKLIAANKFSPQTAGVFENETGVLDIIVPKRLKEGSKVAITAPASSTTMWEIDKGVKSFKSLSCNVVVGDIISKQKNKYNYFSAPDEQRLDEFMSFIVDDSVDAIVCGRGGFGVMRILDKLDYELIRANPKIIMGFSDITALLLAIYTKSKVVSYHGPVASSSFNSFTVSNLKDVFFTNENLIFKEPNALTMQGGEGFGKLVGGNLKMIVSTLGTPYEIDTTDSILFLEDVGEHPYQIDRMLTQLRLSGKLDTCKGFIFGKFKDINQRKPFYPNYSLTIKEVVEQVIKPYNKPILMETSIGHIENKLTLPIGIKARLNAEKKEIELIENPVV